MDPLRFRMALILSVLIAGVFTLHPVHANPPGWGYAHATFYGNMDGSGTEAGACGYENTFARGYGAMTAALSTPLFASGTSCGACFRLRCIHIKETSTAKNWCWSYSRSIIVTATNSCPPGSTGGWCDPPNQHFDLSMPAFSNLGRFVGGVVPVFYQRVRCARRGGIRITLQGNPYFITMLFHNVGGAGNVRAVKIHSPTTGWIPMFHNWGALWTVANHLQGALSLRITASDGRVITVHNAIGSYWNFGQTWELHRNFFLTGN